MSQFLVVVTDDRFGNYDLEREVLSHIDAELYVTPHEDSDRLAGHIERSAEPNSDSGPHSALLSNMSEESAQAWRDADAMLVNLFPVTRELIAELPRCRVLSRYGTGYDNVDISAAHQRDIAVARVPDYATEEASDHAIAMMLAAVRRLPERDRAVREGAWDKGRSPITRIRGSRLGVIGLGRAGLAVIRKMQSFGLAEVLVYDPGKSPERVAEVGARQVDLATLMESCDIVSLHAPLREETRGLISRHMLESAKPGMVFVNTARGPIVDEAALAESIATGRIAYAGLDVFVHEPLSVHSPLCELGNVILTDHSAYYSEQSIVDLKRGAAQNVAALLRGERIRDLV